MNTRERLNEKLSTVLKTALPIPKGNPRWVTALKTYEVFDCELPDCREIRGFGRGTINRADFERSFTDVKDPSKRVLIKLCVKCEAYVAEVIKEVEIENMRKRMERFFA